MKRWSKKYIKCIKCGTDKIKHLSKGLCKKCYRFEDYHKKNTLAGHRNRWALKYDNCIKCNTLEFRHEGHGLCYKCYNKSKNKGIPPLKRENRNCSFCGNNISRPPSLMKKKNVFCNRNCLINWKKENSNGENNTFYGKHHTDLTKKILSDKWTTTKKEKIFSKRRGLNHPFYGKKLSEKHIGNIKKAHKGMNPWLYMSCPNEAKQKISKTLKEKYIKKEINTGFKKGHKLTQKEKHPLWKGGISFEPYGIEFNKQLKEAIRRRDNLTCQECGFTEEQLKYKLRVHHIDYNKKNNNPNNLISLCKSCHTQTNFKRENWTEYFKNKVFT